MSITEVYNFAVSTLCLSKCVTFLFVFFTRPKSDKKKAVEEFPSSINVVLLLSPPLLKWCVEEVTTFDTQSCEASLELSEKNISC